MGVPIPLYSEGGVIMAGLKSDFDGQLSSFISLTLLTVKGRGIDHTLDIATLSEGTSLHRRSGLARVVEGFHSFTCTPTHSAQLKLVLIYRTGREGMQS